MTATTVHPRPARREPRRRSGPVIAGLTAVLALWLGFTAPSISPVAPASAPVGQAATAAGPPVGPASTSDLMTPLTPAPAQDTPAPAVGPAPVALPPGAAPAPPGRARRDDPR